MTHPRHASRALIILFTAALLLGCPLLLANPTPPPPEVSGRAITVVRLSNGEILFERASRTPVPVASTQKLLTALIAVASGRLDSYVTVPPEAASVSPTKLYLKPGERYRKRDLLISMLVRSHNDAASTLAAGVAGSEVTFAKTMNQAARYLGAVSSTFYNASGLPAEGQKSTAFDIAIIARAALADPVIRGILHRPNFTFVKASGEKVSMKNTNRLLFSREDCLGGKTGFTRAAGNCLVVAAASPCQSEEVLVVILGSSRPKIWEDAQKLLDWGLSVSLRKG